MLLHHKRAATTQMPVSVVCPVISFLFLVLSLICQDSNPHHSPTSTLALALWRLQPIPFTLTLLWAGRREGSL